MASKLEIWNMALSHLGVGKSVSVETERSEEANACKVFYDIALETTLRGFNWPFATKFLALGLVSENPTVEWGYAYRYPSDCLKLRRLLSPTRNDNRQSRIPYVLVQDDAGHLIYTDLPDAEMEYTVRNTSTSLFSSDFSLALSYKLALLIAPRVSGPDLLEAVLRKVESNYILSMSMAAAEAANEVQDEEEPESEFTRVRD